MGRVQYYLGIRISAVEITGNPSPLQTLNPCFNPKVAKVSLFQVLTQPLTFALFCHWPAPCREMEMRLERLFTHVTDRGLPHLSLTHVHRHTHTLSDFSQSPFSDILACLGSSRTGLGFAMVL